MKHTLMAWMLLTSLTVLPAAEPPEYINYQGVLRDADDSPLDGLHDMTFHFYDREASGSGIRFLTDIQTGVVVSDGLFSVHLGDGTMIPGTHDTLAEVFANENEVWLDVEIGGENLSPRIRVIAAAYALNAGHLAGRDAGSFLDTSATPQTKAGTLTTTSSSGYGVEGYGSVGGGYFEDTDGTGSAYVGMGDTGIYARGASMGGYFLSTDSLSLAQIASGNYGIWADGYVAGGHFAASLASGEAWVGYGNRGIEAQGTEMGGYFEDKDGTGSAYLGKGDTGIYARGASMGGYFLSTDSLSLAQIASGNYGIWADGYVAGGHFAASLASGEAWVGYGNRGIEAQGTELGGYFKDTDATGYANVGIGDKGIEGFGSYMGGYFKDTDDLSDAKIAFGGYGIRAYGNTAGGNFEDLDPEDSGIAHVAEGDRGIRAYGDLDGGYFGNYFSGVHCRVATDLGESTAGPGTKNFIQNHPYEKDKVIRYSSLEGDEVGTYTRGVARLENGVARIPLGETFRWVTNPDIGLTAQLTARGRPADLYVDSLTTGELVVRSAEGSPPDVAFDYVVNGLRIGFEESSVVHEKPFEAYIPSMNAHRALYERRPELRDFNALERFKVMDAAAGRSADFDFSRAVALKDAVGEYDPAIHWPVDQPETPAPLESEPSEGEGTAEDDPATDTASRRPVRQPGPARILVDRRTPRAEEEPLAEADLPARFPASEPIETGDILVLDTERPGHLRPASGVADAAVFGIAAAEAETVDEEPWVELVESRYAHVKADASYGAILPGDLLVSSPTPGHAMRAIAPLPGTIVGKAAERLDSGAGLIKILVMLR